MNILVLLKQTFDTEEKIIIKDGEVIDDGAEFIINPYDEYAVEEAVQIKEEHGGEVTVVTLGPDRCEEALRTALAMGADRAFLIECDGGDLNDLDEHSIAKILASFAREGNYDIIIGGYMAVDDGSAQVGPRVAEELDIPHVNTIISLEIEGEIIRVQKDVEGDLEFIEATIPVLVTTQQGLNEPRYPSLPMIMKSKKKPLEYLDIDDLNISEEKIESKTIVVQSFLPPEKGEGKILEGEIDTQVKELVHLLTKEDKVIV
jgi:electron transfer flavoprotein beta subunit